MRDVSGVLFGGRGGHAVDDWIAVVKHAYSGSDLFTASTARHAAASNNVVAAQRKRDSGGLSCQESISTFIDPSAGLEAQYSLPRYNVF